TILNSFDLDAITDEEDYELPGKLCRDLTQQIDRRQCQRVRIEQTTDGDWFLRWEVRHPEMVSAMEYWGDIDRSSLSAKKLAEYHRLVESVLPAKSFELPLSRRQAFA